MSLAGARAGLAGERSGLFREQIRIVKEMRERDRLENGRSGFLCRPRFMGWENVPGTFSSNGGRDFQAVLTEIVRIADPDAPDVPMPEKGRWPKAGCLYDDLGRWSVAWRLHDAQFWNLAQRRVRLSVVADFGGLAAPEVQFERKGLSWYPQPGKEARQEAPGDSGEGADHASTLVLNDQGGAIMDVTHDKTQALRSQMKHHEPVVLTCIPLEGNGTRESHFGNEYGRDGDPSFTLNTVEQHAICYGISGYDSNAMKSSNPHSGVYEAETARALDHNGGSPQSNQGGMMIVQPVTPRVFDARGNGDGSTVPTITGDHQDRVTDYTAICVGNGQTNQVSMEPVANTLDTMHDQQAILYQPNVAHALSVGGNCKFREDSDTYVQDAATMVVRRLTPMECERLQGYPDHWTDIGEWTDSKGKKHRDADSPRYKALGNSIALPYWFRMCRRISAMYDRPATLGSLFDGIGGFPLCWERCNGPHTAIWASEIEEFCVAVTKKHFPEEEY